jgi:hypothetical protein
MGDIPVFIIYSANTLRVKMKERVSNNVYVVGKNVIKIFAASENFGI